MTATSQRLFVLSVLALLMAASRAHVFDHFSPPDASWAVFFVAGFALRGWGRWVFPLLMALAMGIDWMVISRQAASFWDHYCVSAAYWGLVPAYGLLWAGGSWLRRKPSRGGRSPRIWRLSVTAVTPSRMRRRQPCASGWWREPGSAHTRRPWSAASRAVISDPLFTAASTTSTPTLRPLMTRLRRGKCSGSGGEPGRN